MVADTGAIDHMILDKSAFISYPPVLNCQFQMGNNSFAPILGIGLAIIAVNGKQMLICNYLHIPALGIPLYSLCAHLDQYGCSFLRMHKLGMYVFFPSFIIEVNTATDCYLLHELIGCSCVLSSQDYVQPKSPLKSELATILIP